MDSGYDRPFPERARIEGNRGARFCGENLMYLQDILPLWREQLECSGYLGTSLAEGP